MSFWCVLLVELPLLWGKSFFNLPVILFFRDRWARLADSERDMTGSASSFFSSSTVRLEENRRVIGEAPREEEELFLLPWPLPPPISRDFQLPREVEVVAVAAPGAPIVSGGPSNR